MVVGGTRGGMDGMAARRFGRVFYVTSMNPYRASNGGVDGSALIGRAPSMSYVMIGHRQADTQHAASTAAR